ncbi:MAG TPA: hypothetical protein VEZ47_12575 [Gemmatirosa sp.]|nr:hypothetical protein [Gemmatirosa sp.]
MSCVVGLVTTAGVAMGADSVAVEDCEAPPYVIRRDPKVFRVGQLLFGCVDSIRATQLVRYTLRVPRRPAAQDPHEYLVTALVPALRTCLKEGGQAEIRDNREFGSSFLVACAGRLFTIEDDFHVGETVVPYAAIGAGAHAATAALHALLSPTAAPLAADRLAEVEPIPVPVPRTLVAGAAGFTPETIIERALAAAVDGCASVRGPFRLDMVPHLSATPRVTKRLTATPAAALDTEAPKRTRVAGRGRR